jgi:hypothetical protein
MDTGASIITGTSPITLSCWVNLTSDPANYDQAVAIRGSTSKGTARMLGFYGRRAAFNSFASSVTSPTVLSNGTWYHVAATCTSGGTAKVYVNGVLEVSGTVTYNSVAAGNTLVVGRGGVSEYIPAKIDEVAVWDEVLTDGGVSVGSTATGDIATLYNSGVPNDLTLAESYNTDRTANLKGYWRMGDDSNDSASDGGSIATITDSSGNGNDAVQATANNQPTFKALEQSATSSLSFDGGGDYLQTAGFTLGATYSFSMWFNLSASPNANTLLNSEHYYTDGYDNFVFRITDATTIGLYSYSGRSSAQAITITVPTLSTGTWYNLVLTNPGSGSAQGYLNGNSVTTSGSTSRAFTDLQNTKGLLIGDNLTNNNSPFDGELDEVAVFNTALSASEVSSLAASRGAHIMNDLSLSPVVYYRMGEDDSLTNGQTGISQITDASGNGYHATQSTASSQPTASVSSVIYV